MSDEQMVDPRLEDDLEHPEFSSQMPEKEETYEEKTVRWRKSKELFIDTLIEMSTPQQKVEHLLKKMKRILKSMRKAIERFDLLTATNRWYEYRDISSELSMKAFEVNTPEEVQKAVNILPNIANSKEEYRIELDKHRTKAKQLWEKLESHNWIIQKLAMKYIL